MKPKHLFDKDPWMLGEHIPDMDLFFLQIFFSCFANDASYKFIRSYKKVLGTFKKFESDFYFGEKDSYEVAESILKALMERPGFGAELNKNIVSWSHKLVAFAKKTSTLPLEKYSNQQLWKVYAEHDRIHTKLYTYGWLPVAVDMFHNNFTNKVKSHLYAICDTKAEAERVFQILTTPSDKTILAKERESFLVVYEKHKKLLKARKLTQTLKDELKLHAQEWGHLGYIYAGNVNPFDESHYIQELLELAQTNADGKKILAKEHQQLRVAKQQQVKLLKKLKISGTYRRMFKLAQEFALSKLIRRHAQLLNLVLIHRGLLTEIAKRLGVSRYQVQFMLKDEVKKALYTGKADKKLLAERLKHCVIYVERGLETVYVGQMEKKARATIKIKIDKNITELTGQTAQPGYAKGIVKIIFRAKDMAKFNEGDILVSVATDPDVVPVMKKAAAIVTEQGGITSHAAIVSRELGTPCIIGTKVATRVLKDGDLVEVDATKGIVRKLR